MAAIRCGAEQLRAGFDEGHAAGRAGARQAIELGGDAAAVDRVGEAVNGEVLDALKRGVEMDVLPADRQFLGDHLRERSADVLAHFSLHDVHRDLAVGGQGEPDRGREAGHGRAARCLGAAARQQGGQSDTQKCAASGGR